MPPSAGCSPFFCAEPGASPVMLDRASAATNAGADRKLVSAISSAGTAEPGGGGCNLRSNDALSRNLIQQCRSANRSEAVSLLLGNNTRR